MKFVNLDSIPYNCIQWIQESKFQLDQQHCATTASWKVKQSRLKTSVDALGHHERNGNWRREQVQLMKTQAKIKPIKGDRVEIHIVPRFKTAKDFSFLEHCPDCILTRNEIPYRQFSMFVRKHLWKTEAKWDFSSKPTKPPLIFEHRSSRSSAIRAEWPLAFALDKAQSDLGKAAEIGPSSTARSQALKDMEKSAMLPELESKLCTFVVRQEPKQSRHQSCIIASEEGTLQILVETLVVVIKIIQTYRKIYENSRGAGGLTQIPSTRSMLHKSSWQ